MEHVVKVLVSRYGARGWCQRCDWQGPRRADGKLASVDAAEHADWMARRAYSAAVKAHRP